MPEKSRLRGETARRGGPLRTTGNKRRLAMAQDLIQQGGKAPAGAHQARDACGGPDTGAGLAAFQQRGQALQGKVCGGGNNLLAVTGEVFDLSDR